LKPIKQSFTWWAFMHGDESPRKVLEAAKAMGYASAEMMPEKHFDVVHEVGLEIAIIGGHASLTDGLNKRSNHDRIEAELRENIDKAVAHKIPSLICFSGNREGLGDIEGARICAEGLKRVAGYAEKKGINLCVELLNSKVDHTDYQCDRTNWGVLLCDLVGSPRVKLLYDIYHMQIMEGDIIRTIRDNIDYIGHFHTAGNPGRHDMDEEQELYYPAIARAVADLDYDGFVGHEFSPKGDRLEALRAAYEAWHVG
jgi:hydroxypyruvate isomerase